MLNWKNGMVGSHFVFNTPAHILIISQCCYKTYVLVMILFVVTFQYVVFFNLHKNCNTASRNNAEINVIMKMYVLSFASTSKDASLCSSDWYQNNLWKMKRDKGRLYSQSCIKAGMSYYIWTCKQEGIVYRKLL